MNVCATCRRELWCKKTGVVVRIPSTGYCVRGDLFACPSCGASLIVTAREGYMEEKPVLRETYYDLQES